MASFIERFYDFIKEKELLAKGDAVCVGISGGADSVCLLQLLYEIADKAGISLYAFHVNHGLRGDESDSDQKYVESFCAKRDIPLKIYSYDVARLAAENKQSVEEAGRNARKRAAADCMEYFGANKTALAHHLNDCAETLLFNLARGTSLPGLKGITAKNGSVIRPLIIFGRSEIEAELRARNIKWKTDSTNIIDDYSRNKLRLNIIPYFEENINAESVRHMAASARDIEEADEIIKDIADEKAKKLVVSDGSGVLIKNGILKERDLVSGYIIMGALRSLTENLTNIKRLHIDQIRELAGNQPGRALDLPYGIAAFKNYDGIRLERRKKRRENRALEDNAGFKRLGINTVTEFGNTVFETRLFEGPVASGEIPKKKYTKWFDYDKLTDNLELRGRKSGDYLVIDKAGHRKALKRYFTDEKIPKDMRDRTVCVADGSRIIWVVNGRISEDCKIDENTRRVFEVSCRVKEE